MTKYVVISSKVSFGAGVVLGLTEEQSRTRRHLLKKDGKFYKVLEFIQFKKGEIIDIVTQELTKSTLGSLELYVKPTSENKIKTAKAKGTKKQEKTPKTEPDVDNEEEATETEDEVEDEGQDGLSENLETETSETDEDVENYNDYQEETEDQEKQEDV